MTLFFLLESVQFTFTKFDMKRTKLTKNALELMLWTLIETVPRVVMLGSFFFFLVDIEDYFEKDPTKVNGTYQPIAVSVIIDLA